MIEKVWVYDGVKVDSLTPEAAAQALYEQEVLSFANKDIPNKVICKLKKIASKYIKVYELISDVIEKLEKMNSNFIKNKGFELHTGEWGCNHSVDEKKKSIFDGLDDKQALRTMADECAKRGLSIMVNMKLRFVGNGKPVNIGFFKDKEEAFNGVLPKYDEDKWLMEMNEIKCFNSESNADIAFDKIMKTVKDYQDRRK